MPLSIHAPAATTPATIIYGTASPPANTIGNNGDTYINKTTSILYGPKASGAWPAGVSFAGGGTPGTNGSTVIYGTATPPANTVGNNGDTYINNSTWTVYGPKASGAWPAGTSLIGPAGQPGTAGASVVGPAGPTGPAGPVSPAIIWGSGAPASGTGVVGQSYVDSVGLKMYAPKTSSGWGASISFGSGFVPSASGTTIPSATSITDSSGNVWTVVSGVAKINGTTAGTNSAVSTLLYYGGTIYYVNTSNAWFSWSGTAWATSSNPQPATASASGTTVPFGSVSTITDSTGAIWSISSTATVLRNGVAAGTTSDVTLLLYYNGVLYQENYADNFYSWVNSAWVQTTNPRTVVSSPSGTVVPTSASSLLDEYGNTWTLVSGVPAQNGYPDPTGLTSVSSLLFYNNVVYSVTTTGAWASWQSNAWNATTDPRIVVSGMTIPFYGVNCHYIQGGIYSSIPLATQTALIQSLGMGVARQDCYNASDLSTMANTIVPGMAPLKVIPCFIPNFSSTPAATYTACKALGVTAANLLAGKVPMFEIGNEWDLLALGNNAQTTDGNLLSQYNQTSMALSMAAMRGVIDGWKSVDTTTRLAVNCTYIHFPFLQMMVNGTLPDGSAAANGPIPFDILTWHQYFSGGDPEQIDGLSGVKNIFTSVAALTSKPMFFSETGGGEANTTNANCVAWIGTAYTEFAAQGQCIGAAWYELYDYTDGAYGLYSMNGSTPTAKPQVATIKAFIAAHPKAAS